MGDLAPGQETISGPENRSVFPENPLNLDTLEEYQGLARNTDDVLRREATTQAKEAISKYGGSDQQAFSEMVGVHYAYRAPCLAEIKASTNKPVAELMLVLRLNTLRQLAAGQYQGEPPRKLADTIASLEKGLGFSKDRGAGDVVVEFLNSKIAEAESVQPKVVKAEDRVETLNEKEVEVLKNRINRGEISPFSFLGKTEEQVKKDLLVAQQANAVSPEEVSALKKVIKQPVLDRINQSIWGDTNLNNLSLRLNGDWQEFSQELKPSLLGKVLKLPLEVPRFMANNKLITFMFLTQLFEMLILSTIKEAQSSGRAA